MASADPITAITVSLPPAEDYLMYLTILEYNMSPEILPTLEGFLQDPELTQHIGWDLIHLLLPQPGAEKCLTTIARLGNPREVILKVTEELQKLDLESVEEEGETPPGTTPNDLDGFCTLVNLLSILHPRIKTKHPSRFLSTSLMAVLTAFRPSNRATLALIAFVHTVFPGKKRPPLPGRKSSLQIPTSSLTDQTALDPEAQDEDPAESAIQAKLLQSFVTHVLEEYVNANTLEWAARLQEAFEPRKVVAGRTSLGEAFREEVELQTRDTIVGQLVAIARDLGLTQYPVLFDAIYNTDSHPSEYETEYPSTPGDIPLSQAGSLFLITSFIFSSIIFGSQMAAPELSIFPDHAKLVKHFIGTNGPMNIGGEETGVIDAILGIGLWLEHHNHFVSGPLEDEDFLQHLQFLSLLSANNPSPTLRYAAHTLTSSILHAHPVDRLRLTFITDTLEECPFETLKGSAVSWLKEEIITAQERKSHNAFDSTVALAAAQPYLFPDTSSLASADDMELIQELEQSFPFHMSVVNFLYFVGGKQYTHVVPTGMMSVVEEIYLGPLRTAQQKALKLVEAESENSSGGSVVELQLLGDRIALCSAQIND
ncbi:DUF1760-domain-containing protein [Mollisia scopiformis]|uniref:DUF1760-domain-containing protein n=1 Tax=Mollisia scopiformis TaxID=149040 RepID=A0A132BCQ4_MOLSC|nr:DUF1760-domain-containing protein [Mollisia scopiformis]KUJ10210.1 DUF1760-domain-containing protein [Mollisia scopiformis]